MWFLYAFVLCTVLDTIWTLICFGIFVDAVIATSGLTTAPIFYFIRDNIQNQEKLKF